MPDNITVDDLLSNSYRSTPRNKKIAETFKDMGLIEKYGSGIRRIIDYFKEENRRLPEFTNISDGFMVTVFVDENNLNSVKKTKVKKIENVPENVPENRTALILNLIKKNKNISMLEISKILNVNHKTIKRDIESLKLDGKIERIGPDKGGYWKVLK